MKTKDQIAELKRDWLADPTWDIETTPDFEEHHDELLQFRRDTEARWECERADRLDGLAERLGCPVNLKLAEYVEQLESRLLRLEGRLLRLEHHQD